MLRPDRIILLIAAITLAAFARTAPAGTAEGELARDSGPYASARRLLPGTFRELETARYVVLFDTDEGWTRRQAELLERAHREFHRFCAGMGLEPTPLRHKLVAVLFADRDDYRRFAQEHDDVADASLSGYYAPRFDRIVFYDVASSPSVTQARQQLDAMEAELRSLAGRAERAAADGDAVAAGALRDARQRYERHLEAQRRRVDDYAWETSVATTIHEAIHQLLFHTQIQSSRSHYPLWISEGLATAFETDEPCAPFGPGCCEASWRERRGAERPEAAAAPLRELVQISRLGAAQPERSSQLYRQSGALVEWLCRERPRELRTYLRLMREQTGRRLTDGEQLALFERAFGDVSALERAWLDGPAETLAAVE